MDNDTSAEQEEILRRIFLREITHTFELDQQTANNIKLLLQKGYVSAHSSFVTYHGVFHAIGLKTTQVGAEIIENIYSKLIVNPPK